MNKKIFTVLSLTSLFVLTLTVSLSINSIGSIAVYGSSTGSPGGKTNSPGDGLNCTQCHSGTLNPGNATALISSSGLLSGYTPGQTYTINVAITGTTSSKIGFEVTAEKDSNNTKIGTIIITDSPRTKTVNFGKAVTHNSSAGTLASSGANAWSFDWTAPIVGTGNVTFYGAFNVTNSSSTSSGDQIYTTSFAVNENIASQINEISSVPTISIFPNPAVNYFHISVNKKIEEIEIYNISGQKVLQQKFDNSINTEGFTSGIYIVKLFSGNEELVKKLIIQ